MSNIDKLKPGKYAILFRNNWDGEGDTYETFAILDAEGIWRDEDGDELLEYQGDEVLKAWPLDDGSNVLELLDELEAKDRRLEEEIGRANREHHRGFMMACGHLKEHSNVHYADAAEMEIVALRKRINELESAAAGKGE